MKILVIGKNGQLGKCIKKAISYSNNSNKFFFVAKDIIDLSQNKSIESYFKKNLFDIIINCAAYTQVDKAEEEEDLANKINNLAVSQLAHIAKEQQAKLINISTDYVFDGKSNRPYTENDKANPINVYGKTKLLGEKAIREIMPTNAMIIRTSWVYSQHGNNFVKNMMVLGKQREELNVVSDQIGSPTYAIDLAFVILKIIDSKYFHEENQPTMTFHYSNTGVISWYEFAKEIFKQKNIDCRVNPILSKQYPTLAKRPKNTLMSNSKILATFKIESIFWKDSLKKFLNS